MTAAPLREDDAQHDEVRAVIAMAIQTDGPVAACQMEADHAFRV